MLADGNVPSADGPSADGTMFADGMEHILLLAGGFLLEDNAHKHISMHAALLETHTL